LNEVFILVSPNALLRSLSPPNQNPRLLDLLHRDNPG
jgi:hypothetical protein